MQGDECYNGDVYKMYKMQKEGNNVSFGLGRELTDRSSMMILKVDDYVKIPPW